MNYTSIYGRLVRDPELKTSAAGKQFCTFTVAENLNKDDVNFWDCVAFGKTGEFIHAYFNKGSGIHLTGSFRQNKYTDKDGNKRTSVNVTVDKVEFSGGKGQGNEPKAEDHKEEFAEIQDDSELPF